VNAEDLRARLEEEIAALDQDSREGENVPEMQALLDIDQTPGEVASAGGYGDAMQCPEAKRSLWPAVLTGVFVLVVLLVWMRLRG
jgi:hypothetical protein